MMIPVGFYIEKLVEGIARWLRHSGRRRSGADCRIFKNRMNMPTLIGGRAVRAGRKNNPMAPASVRLTFKSVNSFPRLFSSWEMVAYEYVRDVNGAEPTSKSMVPFVRTVR